MTDRTEPDDAPALDAVLDLAEAAADVQHLLHLDRIWTAAENTGDGARDRVARLGDRLEDHLGRAERYATVLAGAFAGSPDWVNDRVRAELSDDHVDPVHAAGIRRFLAAPGDDYAARGRMATEHVLRTLPAERAELRRKVGAVRGSGPLVTDMSHEMFCNLAAGGMIADLAVCPETLGVGCAAALAVYLLADSEGC